MYLSMLELNPRSRQVQAELRDPYQMHRTLSKAFGEGDEYKDARCLFRIDESRTTGGLHVLMQSTVAPDWRRLAGTKDYLVSEPQVKEFQPRAAVGRRLHFRLRANPTVKRDGRRYGIGSDDDKRAWLERKGEAGGFRVIDASIVRDITQRSRTTNGFAAEFVATIFDGTIEVTDSVLFATALECGIGSAKGFGFGLLSVAPAR